MLTTQPWGLRYASHLGFRSPYAPLFRESVRSSEAGAHVRFARSLGFAGVQFPWALSAAAAAIESFREAALETGVEGSCIVSAPFEEFRQPLWGLGTAAARTLIERRMRQACEVACMLRSSTIAVVATADPAEDRAIQLERFAGHLRGAATIAADHGITLVVETMRTVPNMLADGYEELHDVICRADHPSVRMLFDTFHVHSFHAHDGVVACFEKWHERIGLIQLADYPGKVEPGAGTLDFVGLLALVMRRTFRGLVELEHLWSGEGVEIEAQGIARLRRIDSSAQLMVREEIA